ncbi:MAG: CDP-diacylglycerol--serine O-phosphatidyltransferase [Deltaproteobacteria bacterium]|nr:CDP-diacylglycerol--serine O-phosphatidyltransferase [Deltaproteobacteria bacterium]
MNTSDKPKFRGVYILPNMMTLASMFSAFLGILWAIDGEFEKCALAILVSCLFDGLDGKLARLTNSTSDFGVQLDSLADLVAFGVTPGIMVYLWQTHIFGRLGILTSFMLMACGALRLARFNISTGSTSKKFFIGLPIPAAACTLASLVLFSPYLPESMSELNVARFSLALIMILSVLMVSNIRYASFKDSNLVRSHRFSATVTALMVFILVASVPKLLAFVFFIGYIVSGPIYSYVYLPLHRSSRLRERSHKLS